MKNMQETYLLWIVPAIPHEGGIRFLHPARQYDVPRRVSDMVWALLACCNGRQGRKAIIRKVAAAGGWPSQVIESAIASLCTLDIIVPADQAFMYTHLWGDNPAPYSFSKGVGVSTPGVNGRRLSARRIRLASLPGSQVYKLAADRKSCRSYTDKGLTMSQLGHMLQTGYSTLAHTTPSAGGFYPLRLHCILPREQDGLATGYYHYDSHNHSLTRYADFDEKAMKYCFNSETLLYGAPVIIVIAGNLSISPKKYGNRGYRFTLMEAGHAAQNIHLASQEAGLASLEYGGFLDLPLATELKMDVSSERPLIGVAVGHASAQPAEGAEDLFTRLSQELVGHGKTIKTLSFIDDSKHQLQMATAVARYTLPGANKLDPLQSGWGAAASRALAGIKAIAEARERQLCETVRVDVRATAKELTGEWIDPRVIAPLTNTQYQHTHYLQPFTEDSPWEWVRGQREGGEEVLVPVDIVYYGSAVAKLGRKPCVMTSSSGVAAFTSRAGAVERSLLELLERDALMRRWFTKEVPLRVPIRLLPYHWQRRIKYWASQKREVFVLDYSTKEVPIIGVMIWSKDYPCLVSGASASLESVERAIDKAFQEAELQLIDILKNRAHLQPIAPADVRRPDHHAQLYYDPNYAKRAKWLLGGADLFTLSRPKITVGQLLDKYNPVIVDVSSPGEPLYVARVLCEQLVPIYFGKGLANYTHASLDKAALTANVDVPHYFS